MGEMLRDLNIRDISRQAISPFLKTNIDKKHIYRSGIRGGNLWLPNRPVVQPNRIAIRARCSKPVLEMPYQCIYHIQHQVQRRAALVSATKHSIASAARPGEIRLKSGFAKRLISIE